METVLTLLGAAGLWLLWELVGGLLGELLNPIFDLCGRVLTRFVNGWTVEFPPPGGHRDKPAG